MSEFLTNHLLPSYVYRNMGTWGHESVWQSLQGLQSSVAFGGGLVSIPGIFLYLDFVKMLLREWWAFKLLVVIG